MSNQWLGVVVSGEKAIFVHLDCNNEEPQLVNQFTWALQDGDKPAAYALFFERTKDYVRENGIHNTVIKASAVGREKVKLGHLHSAELRGVVCVAAQTGGSKVTLVQKATVSRTFGERKADDYVKDDHFWEQQVDGDIAKTRREAALLILSQKG